MATIFRKYDVRLVQEHSGLYDLNREIKSSTQAAEICKQLYDMHNLSYEKMVVITLNPRLEVVGCFEVARGTVDKSPVYVREIATRALLTNAKSVIIAHNHPAGSVNPSKADIEITKRTKDALAMLSIGLVDHIIIGHDKTYSMADKGQI